MNKQCVFLTYLLVLLSCFSSNPQRVYASDPSSIADTHDYRMFCLVASTDDAYFKNFKIYPVYQQFLENVTYDLGLAYLKIIKEKYAGLLNHLEAFQSNDLLGNPYTYSYDIGRFSPTTLRYIKVAGDLLSLFPDIGSMKIIEIGAGYGGQCKILSDLDAFEEYIIVDLPEALALAQKYLEILNVKNVRFLTPEQLKKENYDLVISNYAFSKCSRETQMEYIIKVLKNSSSGYLTMDFLPFSFKAKPYSVSELVNTLISDPTKYVRIFPEDPLPSPKNVIMTWKKK